jgi:Uma2 family endonuclease
MNMPLQQPWTPERFFDWAEAQAARYELEDGRPVAMTGGTIGHGIIMRNLHLCLNARLRGLRCQPFGPDVGVATTGSSIRYPDALVTCSDVVPSARTVPGSVIVFEIISPSSGRVDRIIKVREYAAIASVRRYVLIESTTAGLLVLHRDDAKAPWTALTLTGADVLALPEVGIELPVAELYERLDLPDAAHAE